MIQIQHLLKLNMQELLETLLGCVYNSNTTLVKVKLEAITSTAQANKFKYNTC